MTNLRRQTTNRKIGNFEAIEKDNLAIPIDVVPPSTNPPPANRKRGRPAKTTLQNTEAGSSSRQPSMLNLLLQVASGCKFPSPWRTRVC